MLDLSPEAVKAYWQERHDAALLRIIEAMEAVEAWVLDGDIAVEESLTRLVAELNSTPNFELQNEEELINILSSIKASRALRVLQYIDTLKPGAASKLLIYAEVSSNEPDDLPGFFLKRNLVFERLQLMGRIFSSDRVDLVMKSIDKDET